MNDIILNKQRIGNFTSSKIVALTSLATNKVSPGKPFYTYVKNKNKERRLGRSLDNEATSRTTTWGKFLEWRVFDGLLGPEYIHLADQTFMHAEIDCWAGSPDLIKDEGETIADIKCPNTLSSFCDLVQPLYDGLKGIDAMNKVRDEHKDGDTYYWQLVSNSIIKKSKYAELIVYAPYQSELEAIRESTSNHDGNQNKIAWINFSEDTELPYLIEGGYYKNLNTIRFLVPEEDKQLLTSKVIAASKLLIPREPSVLLATLDENNLIVVDKG